MGINLWVGVGRITKDIELRYTQSNLAVAKFTIAIDRKYKGDNAERATDYIQVVVWRLAAENVSKYCSKGSLVGITGAIQTGSYDDKDGKRVYTTEINADSVQFLDSKKDTFNDQDSRDVYNDIKAGQAKGGTIDVDESDLPF